VKRSKCRRLASTVSWRWCVAHCAAGDVGLAVQASSAIEGCAHLDRASPGAERYRASDLCKQALVNADAAQADHLLKPDFGHWVSLSRGFRERAIEAGYRETLAQAAALRGLHAA
jgi:NTE family protein